jgi:phosphoglycolate phosphatase-like HAD superfamily hydrolase
METNTKIKLVIFDWDDVFTKGSTDGYLKCYHEALVGVGVALSAQEESKRIEAKWGQPHREELKELLKENLDLLDKACEIYEGHFFGNTFVDCLSVTPNSKELVERLSKKYILTVATGINSNILHERVIPKFKFPNVFTQIVSAYDIDVPSMAKPHPHMAELILNQQGISADETILVGDAKNDMLMARAAGITPVAVLSGHMTREDATSLGVKHIISDVTFLEKVISEIENK